MRSAYQLARRLAGCSEEATGRVTERFGAGLKTATAGKDFALGGPTQVE